VEEAGRMAEEKDRSIELGQDLEATDDEAAEVKGGAHPERRFARTRKLRRTR